MNKNHADIEFRVGLSSGRKRRHAFLSAIVLAGLVGMVIAASPAVAPAATIAVGISVGIAPPALPVYVQPPCPAPGYIWTPGYWAYNPDGGYYWVPGTWIMPPTAGFLWTPGYWGWGGVAFVWHAGYWGPHVGFYGGINYGFGYPGVGFVGGEWRGGAFFYNRAVNNFAGVHITNVYYHPVANNFSVNRVAYNGGRGGLTARPTAGEMIAARDRHIAETAAQRQNTNAAMHNRAQFASVNHGRPDVAAARTAGNFRGADAVHATRAGGSANPGAARNAGSRPESSGTYRSSSAPRTQLSAQNTRQRTSNQTYQAGNSQNRNAAAARNQGRSQAPSSQNSNSRNSRGHETQQRESKPERR